MRAAVGWFAAENATHRVPIGVAGYGEGGLVAFYAAALDTRIDAALVSGYFQPRELLWKEPIYRDVWGLLREFGDAEIAAARSGAGGVMPHVTGPPRETADRTGATPNGTLTTPPITNVQAETAKPRSYFQSLHAEAKLEVITREDADKAPGSDAALSAWLAIILAEMQTLAQSRYVPPDYMAMVYEGLGDRT